MKFFAVFSALVAVALASPSWDLHELSAAIQNPATDPALIPVFEQALNDLMLAIFNGSQQESIVVVTGAQDLSSWTLNELSEAIQDPATDAALLPYLEEAINSMMASIMAGNNPEFIIVATPVGLLPVESVLAPTPVESVVVPSPVETPVAPPTSASSPLVQIIVNVKSQEAVAPAPVTAPELPSPVVPSPVVLPAPVAPEVHPSPVVVPEPLFPVHPSPVVVPEPLFPVHPSPVVVPEPLFPVHPSPVVLPGPNPDFIAVNPVGVNPVDLIHPVPVVAPVNVVDGIMV